MKNKKSKRQKRHSRVRAKINGTSSIPRLSVFRSNKHIYAQLIDDEKNKTLASASDLDLKLKSKTKKKENDLSNKELIAYRTGAFLAKKALNLSTDKQKKKIEKVVFDRGGYKYHGRIKALAQGARENGLKF